ncbi:MAG: aspartyl protease family protein [Candidatus Methylomirabilis sp.]
MGVFSIKVTVANPQDPARQQLVELLVDTGATLSIVPAVILRDLGISPRRIGKEFETISGAIISRDIGQALFQIDQEAEMTPVVVGEAADAPVLGAVTLEALGFGVDPLRKRLIPQRFQAKQIQ